MKRILIAITAAIAFSACNSETEKQSAPEATDTAAAIQTPAPAPMGAIDPVCEMPKENGWTDYVVNGTDTTWFCSSTCKDAYSANPTKYKKS